MMTAKDAESTVERLKIQEKAKDNSRTLLLIDTCI